ncbi:MULTISPECIES: hypothetical protein [unclassified Nocardioides]|uniref:hypothetical protein n=1 Tax=unclassified Nocardioides TaxID=2615069 RepID=UPI000056F722|nr:MULTISPECIES: hypothetical protein [unclassified Nocardioides]ABL80893.1 hypothetical protein Noca_1379 [Nocardioides sp. JS614]
MTTKLAHPVLRSVLSGVRRSTVVLLAGSLVLLAAGPAGADTPEGWPVSDKVDPVHAVLLLGGVPLLLIAVIAVLVMVPGRGRERHALASGDDQWFGGPRQGTAELPPAEAGETGAGGASARW